MRLEVTPDDLAGAERQDLICEQADIDRAYGAEHGHARKRGKQEAPTPAVEDVHQDIDHDGDCHPAPVHPLDVSAHGGVIDALQYPVEAKKSDYARYEKCERFPTQPPLTYGGSGVHEAQLS